ncbi:MAG: hypothetical protein OWU84_01355 [Firmicutes bacterium]|nr:hypothetical protein [Bacillota bacterium]
MDLLLPEPIIRHRGPSTLRVTVNAQPHEARWVVHLLHYIPERRAQAFDIIEDVIPLHDLALSVKAEHPVQAVRLVPEGVPLAFSYSAGRIEFTVPRVSGHQLVEIAWQ